MERFLAASGEFVPNSKLVPCDGSTKYPCDFAALWEMLHRLLNFMILAAILVSVGLIVYTGFKYLTAGSNKGQLAQAKKSFATIAIGFLLMLGAWLIIDTVVKVLLDTTTVDKTTNKPFFVNPLH